MTALQQFAKMGAALVEEHLRKWAVGLVKTVPATPPQKLALAVSYARELAPDGLEKFSDKQVNFVCPWHGYEYDLRTGECAADRRLRLKKYNVVRKGDDIFVSI